MVDSQTQHQPQERALYLALTKTSQEVTLTQGQEAIEQQDVKALQDRDGWWIPKIENPSRAFVKQMVPPNVCRCVRCTMYHQFFDVY